MKGFTLWFTGLPCSGKSTLAEKVKDIQQTGAEVVICNEPGCMMNIAGACRRAGCSVRLVSLAEVIAEGLGVL